MNLILWIIIDSFSAFVYEHGWTPDSSEVSTDCGVSLLPVLSWLGLCRRVCFGWWNSLRVWSPSWGQIDSMDEQMPLKGGQRHRRQETFYYKNHRNFQAQRKLNETVWKVLLEIFFLKALTWFWSVRPKPERS